VNLDLGTLAGGLGYSPLGVEAYPSSPDSRTTYRRNSEFVWVWYRCDDPSPISALPPWYYGARLALKLFRGVRAISEFDWSFAPTLSSSERFSTHISSGLHEVLPSLHPDQG